jgi:hypothetical protein
MKRTTAGSTSGAVRIEGAIIGQGVIDQIAAGDVTLEGLSPKAYHLDHGQTLGEAVTRSWNRLLAIWKRGVPDDAPAGVTRDRLLLPLFEELRFGRLPYQGGVDLPGSEEGEATRYPITHAWEHVPIHLVGRDTTLDARTEGVAGAARRSPHGLVQEFLNLSDGHLWGMVSNGHVLRILRDNRSITRTPYIEFDLDAIFDGELYSDFKLLWLLSHQSRVEGPTPEQCHLERWRTAGIQRGERALDALQAGVERAITLIGSAILSRSANAAVRDALRSGELSTQDYYREILLLVYRLIFLFVAEDRDALLLPVDESSATARETYMRYYSTTRLRRIAERYRGNHRTDLYHALRTVMRLLHRDGSDALALPALGSDLWSPEGLPYLGGAEIDNESFLVAIRELAFTRRNDALWRTDFRSLGSEELGGVYEALLEQHPQINLEAARFELATAGGNERKTTGSYYTPHSLVNALLDTALDPVLDRAARSEDPQEAILGLRVVDPAVGSGHFLVAAAQRIGKRLAAVRTGEDEPAPGAVRQAVRDVTARCLYGVDINPMAVELCKVSLWMEALEPGRPLSFLDHHIKVGNSLLGATPELIAEGIPDSAFAALTLDDTKVVSAWKKRNKEERKELEEKQGDLFGPEPVLEKDLEQLSRELSGISAVSANDLDTVAKLEARYHTLERSDLLRRDHLIADAWCAAFVWPRDGGPQTPDGITAATFDALASGKGGLVPDQQRLLDELSRRYRFFHWHLEFADVFFPEEGRDGGFDVVLGNPPWDQLQMSPKEFFAHRDPAIAEAPHMSAAQKMIKKLESENPALYRDYVGAKREVDGIQHLVHNTGNFPLTSYGRINLAPLFVELGTRLVGKNGRVGNLVPSSIATDSFNQYFFRSLIDTRTLSSLYDFENKDLFPAVDSRFKFCLITMAGGDLGRDRAARFVFFAHAVEELTEPDRLVELTPDDFRRINPNTRTTPIFRSRRDAEITRRVYSRVPVLVDEEAGEQGNPWGFKGLLMFMMNTDSGLFRTRQELETEGWQLEGNRFVRDGAEYVPLYEAKMAGFYDHRVSDVIKNEANANRQQQPRSIPIEEKRDPNRLGMPYFWVDKRAVDERLANRWGRGWLLGWRDITSSTNERTVIASVIPRVGVGHTMPLMMFPTERSVDLSNLIFMLNSYALDFVARQKIGGNHMTYGYMHQIPILPPAAFSAPCPWDASAGTIADWIKPRVLELVYTAWDMQPFARDLGYDGPPFAWDEERRFHLRCELDAAMFHLYGLPEEDVDYVMDQFPIVKRKDEKAHGEYRTKQVVLERYREMH